MYVFILTSVQEKSFKDTNPHKHYAVDDKYFFEELSRGLDRQIEEKYDPQKVAADARPNMYIYMVHGDDFYFAVHLYRRNFFTKQVERYYYKMELSNEDSAEYKLYSYETLKNHEQYLELLNKNPAKQQFFDDLDEQYRADSQH